LISNSNGEAINIEENVPTIVPKIITKVNHFIVSGPKINIVIKTKARVKLVYILLVKVSLTEIFIISFKSFFFHQYCFKFDLILSNTTIVSFIEYHKIVKRAVIKNVSILNSGKKLDTSI
jgi:hypothetical protein